MEKIYTSVKLSKDLLEQKHICGTLQINRRDNPRKPKNKKFLANKAKTVFTLQNGWRTSCINYKFYP